VCVCGGRLGGVKHLNVMSGSVVRGQKRAIDGTFAYRSVFREFGCLCTWNVGAF
jgi:hypothetical protein